MNAYPQKVQTHIVEHTFSVHATGVGKLGVPPFALALALALANAIFAATGKRFCYTPIGMKV